MWLLTSLEVVKFEETTTLNTSRCGLVKLWPHYSGSIATQVLLTSLLVLYLLVLSVPIVSITSHLIGGTLLFQDISGVGVGGGA